MYRYCIQLHIICQAKFINKNCGLNFKRCIGIENSYFKVVLVRFSSKRKEKKFSTKIVSNMQFFYYWCFFNYFVYLWNDISENNRYWSDYFFLKKKNFESRNNSHWPGCFFLKQLLVVTTVIGQTNFFIQKRYKKYSRNNRY